MKSKTRLESFLQQACAELELRIEAPCTIFVREGLEITALALLPQLGASKGMIIVNNYEELGGVADDLVISGYGYSVLGEPSEVYERDNYVELFSDWGWGDLNGRKPDWMT